MIEITPQAIDQASNRVRGLWLDTRLKPAAGDEGLGFYSWLMQEATAARKFGQVTESGKYRYHGMKFGFLPAYRGDGIATPKIFHILQTVERVR